MKHSFLYSLKVWLTAVLGAPLLIILILFFLDIEMVIIVFIAFFGFILSIPSWLILFLLVDFLSYRMDDEIQLKKMLACFAFFLTFLPILTWLDPRDKDLQLGILIIGTPYFMCIIWGIFFYRIHSYTKSIAEN